MPKITVIMPVYNGELFLEEAIDSVLNQTFKDFILLIINDASTDGTQKIINKYSNIDKRISYFKNDINLGIAKSRNIAIDSTKTELIAFLDADDKIVSTRFEKQIHFLKNNPKIGVCGSWYTYFGNKSKVIDHNESHEEIKIDLLSHCSIQNSSVMLRKSILGDLRFDEDMIVAEDYSLWSQLIAKTKFHNIQESLVFYRWHEKNISKTERDKFETSQFIIRARQLENIGIFANDPNLKHFVNAVSLKRNESAESVIKTVKASYLLKANNKSYNYFNQELFEAHIDNTIIRTMRNAINYDKNFYKFIKEESGYFNKLPKLDIAYIYLKSCL